MGWNILSIPTTVEVWEWINNFIPHFTGACDYSSMLGLKLIHVSKSDNSYSFYHYTHILSLSIVHCNNSHDHFRKYYCNKPVSIHCQKPQPQSPLALALGSVAAVRTQEFVFEISSMALYIFLICSSSGNLVGYIICYQRWHITLRDDHTWTNYFAAGVSAKVMVQWRVLVPFRGLATRCLQQKSHLCAATSDYY